MFGQNSAFGGGNQSAFGQNNQSAFQNQGNSFGGQSQFGGGFQNTSGGFGQQNNQFGGQKNFNNQGSDSYKQENCDSEIPHQFRDSVSCITIMSCQGNKDFAAISSWDGQIQLYQIQQEQSQQNSFYKGPNSDVGGQQQKPPQVQPILAAQTNGPVLGICFQSQVVRTGGYSGISGQSLPQNPGPIFIAHSDGTVKRWDITQQGSQPQDVASHSQPVKDVYSFCIGEQTFLVSGGWDSLVKFYQIQGNQIQQCGESYVAKPVHQMSGQFPLLVTSHSEKHIHVWDLNRITQGQFDPVLVQESPLKYATSAISCFGDGKGYAIGSIEGRCGIVNINFSNLEQVDTRDFCFKCHRVEKDNQGDIYTVNQIAFNQKHNTFVTTGSDGQWVTWNKDTKSRYKMGNKAPLPITNACFNKDGTLLLFAQGEDWSLGADSASKRNNIVRIFARSCDLDEVYKPQQKK